MKEEQFDKKGKKKLGRFDKRFAIPLQENEDLEEKLDSYEKFDKKTKKKKLIKKIITTGLILGACAATYITTALIYSKNNTQIPESLKPGLYITEGIISDPTSEEDDEKFQDKKSPINFLRYENTIKSEEYKKMMDTFANDRKLKKSLKQAIQDIALESGNEEKTNFLMQTYQNKDFIDLMNHNKMSNSDNEKIAFAIESIILFSEDNNYKKSTIEMIKTLNKYQNNETIFNNTISLTIKNSQKYNKNLSKMYDFFQSKRFEDALNKAAYTRKFLEWEEFEEYEKYCETVESLGELILEGKEKEAYKLLETYEK